MARQRYDRINTQAWISVRSMCIYKSKHYLAWELLSDDRAALYHTQSRSVCSCSQAAQIRARIYRTHYSPFHIDHRLEQLAMTARAPVRALRVALRGDSILTHPRCNKGTSPVLWRLSHTHS